MPDIKCPSDGPVVVASDSTDEFASGRTEDQALDRAKERAKRAAREAVDQEKKNTSCAKPCSNPPTFTVEIEDAGAEIIFKTEKRAFAWGYVEWVLKAECKNEPF